MHLLLVTAVYLILGSTADRQLCSAPVNNTPPFGDQNPRVPLPLDRIQVIVPAYTFTCHGRVVQWGACVQRGGGGERYDIDFQVLRPSPVSDPGVDCYSLVGSNLIENGRPDGGCIVYDVPVEEQFLVQPGDVVGFFSDHEDSGNNNDGVQVVESRQDVTVHYRPLDDLPATIPGNCMFIVGPGQIDLTIMGAPVITAEVADARFCSVPVANIPMFGDQTDTRIQADRIQAIIPAYTFTCHGRVVQWGACVQSGGGGERYDIDFQVLRQSPVSDPGVDCYSLVGSNLIENGQPVDRCILYDVPVEEQVLVQPGDVVGFFSDDVNRDFNDSVQVIESRQDVVVHYRERDTIPATDPESCMFVVGPGQIDSMTVGAPVITAVVESIILTTFVVPSPTPPAPPVQTPTPLNTGPSDPPPPGGDGGSSSTVAIIAGIVAGSSVLILLIIIGVILICIRQRMTTSKRSVIVTERNDAYMTNIAVERSDIVTERNEAYMTNTAVERSVVITKRNEAYVTNADAIPAAQNEAYGVVGLEDMNSSNKEDTTDCTYETGHLSGEPPCDEYDYVR